MGSEQPCPALGRGSYGLDEMVRQRIGDGPLQADEDTPVKAFELLEDAALLRRYAALAVGQCPSTGPHVAADHGPVDIGPERREPVNVALVEIATQPKPIRDVVIPALWHRGVVGIEAVVLPLLAVLCINCGGPPIPRGCDETHRRVVVVAGQEHRTWSELLEDFGEGAAVSFDQSNLLGVVGRGEIHAGFELSEYPT